MSKIMFVSSLDHISGGDAWHRLLRWDASKRNRDVALWRWQPKRRHMRKITSDCWRGDKSTMRLEPHQTSGDYVAATEKFCATLSDLAKLHVSGKSSKRNFRNLQKKRRWRGNNKEKTRKPILRSQKQPEQREQLQKADARETAKNQREWYHKKLKKNLQKQKTFTSFFLIFFTVALNHGRC